MPPVATDASIVQGHTHLRIIIYLLQFLLCLIQVLLLFHRIRKQRRQTRQSLTHLMAIRFREYHSHLNNPPSSTHTMDAAMTSNPAYNVPAFNGRKQLTEIHHHLTDFLHYQLHIRLDTATSLPPGTLHANQNERKQSSRFSKKNASTSKPSSSLSTALT